MKKFVFIITSLILMKAFGAATQAGTKYNRVSCIGADGDHIVIFGLGTDKVSVSVGFDPMDIVEQHDGDCAGRKTFCYEDGQWMINIPKSLISGNRQDGQLWVNSDTDDRLENNRLGDRYDCTAVRND